MIEGYKRLGKWAIGIFVVFTIGTMFAVQAAVTIVTASLAAELTGIALSPLFVERHNTGNLYSIIAFRTIFCS